MCSVTYKADQRLGGVVGCRRKMVEQRPDIWLLHILYDLLSGRYEVFEVFHHLVARRLHYPVLILPSGSRPKCDNCKRVSQLNSNFRVDVPLNSVPFAMGNVSMWAW